MGGVCKFFRYVFCRNSATVVVIAVTDIGIRAGKNAMKRDLSIFTPIMKRNVIPQTTKYTNNIFSLRGVFPSQREIMTDDANAVASIPPNKK